MEFLVKEGRRKRNTGIRYGTLEYPRVSRDKASDTCISKSGTLSRDVRKGKSDTEGLGSAFGWGGVVGKGVQGYVR